MLENITAYIPWILCGILFLVVLIFFVRGNVKRKADPQGYNSSLTQENTNPANRTSVGGPPQTSQNSVRELNQNISDIKSNLRIVIDEIQSVRDVLYQIVDILQDQDRNRLNNLSTSNKQNRIESEHNQDMRLQNELLEQNTNQNIPPFLPENEKDYTQNVESDMNEQISPVLAEFCEIYNTNQQKALQSHYKTHFRFGVVNALDRIQKQDEPASFQNVPNGKYLAFHIQEEDIYAVVPIYDLILDHRSYGPGGFGEVFDCPDFDSKNRYRVKVVQPAIFEPDYAKENWTLMDKGKLALIEI